jgi:hypothetical protein
VVVPNESRSQALIHRYLSTHRMQVVVVDFDLAVAGTEYFPLRKVSTLL